MRYFRGAKRDIVELETLHGVLWIVAGPVVLRRKEVVMAKKPQPLETVWKREATTVAPILPSRCVETVAVYYRTDGGIRVSRQVTLSTFRWEEWIPKRGR